jgi:hypothetical protein
VNKEEWKDIIKSNITTSGFHITVVAQEQTPRFAYTIGLTEKYNFELVFAGGIFYLKDQLSKIFNQIVKKVNEQEGEYFNSINLEELGTFSILPIDASWSKLLMLGVYDVYKVEKVNAFQIIPDRNHQTLDIPDMTRPFTPTLFPVWRYLVQNWDLNVPITSQVTTNLEFLKGQPLTEIIRWEPDFWEMFHGEAPNIPKEQRRVVSISTIVGIDKTILPALELQIKKGLYRDENEEEWTFWDVNVD